VLAKPHAEGLAEREWRSGGECSGFGEVAVEDGKCEKPERRNPEQDPPRVVCPLGNGEEDKSEADTYGTCQAIQTEGKCP